MSSDMDQPMEQWGKHCPEWSGWPPQQPGAQRDKSRRRRKADSTELHWSCHGMSHSAPPRGHHHDAWPHLKPKAMKPRNLGLKLRNYKPNISLDCFSWFSGIYHSNRKQATPANVSQLKINRVRKQIIKQVELLNLVFLSSALSDKAQHIPRPPTALFHPCKGKTCIYLSSDQNQKASLVLHF